MMTKYEIAEYLASRYLTRASYDDGDHWADVQTFARWKDNKNLTFGQDFIDLAKSDFDCLIDISIEDIDLMCGLLGLLEVFKIIFLQDGTMDGRGLTEIRYDGWRISQDHAGGILKFRGS